MPSVRDIVDRDPEADPITVLTAYDTPTARIVDDAGVDMILVGDSIGDALLGHDSSLPVDLDTMATHTAAVSRGVDDALVVADLPFLSYGVSEAESLRNAGRMLKEAGAGAVKLESGPHTVELTRRLVELGIPVQAHLGLTPQHINRVGLQRQGTDEAAAAEILDLAEAHEEAGAFSLVLEHVPANLAAIVTEEPDHRDRRGAGNRRPGARGQRRRGHLRARAAVREGVRGRTRGDGRGRRSVPRRGRRRLVPR